MVPSNGHYGLFSPSNGSENPIFHSNGWKNEVCPGFCAIYAVYIRVTMNEALYSLYKSQNPANGA